MSNWLLITLLLIGLIAFLILIAWADWIYKCRKSAKDNHFNYYLVCLLVMKYEVEKKKELIVLDGILGDNSSELVFANSFQEEAHYFKIRYTDICGADFKEYNEDEFLEFAYGVTDAENKDVIYNTRTMAGISSSKRMPKSIKRRLLLKIRLIDNNDLYFFYKGSNKNANIAERLQNITIIV